MHVLIIEDDEFVRCCFADALAALVKIETTANAADALALVRSGRFPLVVLGSTGGSAWSAIELLHRIADAPSPPDVIFVPGASCEDLAIAALRSGARDYIKGPGNVKELASAVERWMHEHNRALHIVDAPSERIIGESFAMAELRSYILKIAASMCNVLVTGETGTGKELVAEMIHLQSPRRAKPFVCINCAAVPDLLFESELFGYERGAFTGAASGKDGKLSYANGGTVFLDEVGDMTLAGQAKILRAIESREVHKLGGRHGIPLDVRLVAATNQDLEVLVAKSAFRNDLYYRLNVARIYMPPLRERREDIPGLLEHFLQMFSRKCSFPIKGFSKDAIDCLTEYSWPGNARELRNVVECVFAAHPNCLVRCKDLPRSVVARSDGAGGEPKDDRDRLMDALRMTAWNKSKAGKKLNWSRMTVYRKIAQYGIQRPSKLPPESGDLDGSGAVGHELD